MGKSLVIVESPAKAKTINKYLGEDFKVMASMGHVRDLPVNKLGVHVDEDFAPDYIIMPSKRKVISELKSEAAKSDAVYLAPDPDREGEAICWHLENEVIPEGKPVFRVLFNEITKTAVKNAIQNPGQMNMDRVDAQQARRILDRLVGYLISPILWKKVKRGISAGRVQSVALRMIVEREYEILAFESEEYWTICANVEGNKKPEFRIRLIKWDNENLRLGAKTAKRAIENEEQVREIEKIIQANEFLISAIKRKGKKQNPPAPFTTSKLQQEASRALGFTVKKTMMVAQKLYEGVDIDGEPTGLITYMRTDSTRVSEEALTQVREFIGNTYEAGYLPTEPRRLKQKSNIQDGHECIRPTSPERTPESVASILDKDELRLYTLIWRRFVASQMTAKQMDETVIEITTGPGLFEAKGLVTTFPGFTLLYTEKKEVSDDEKRDLPLLEEGDSLKVHKLETIQNFTKPPSRYSEASLVKALEENGIGRPSTYAMIINTIQHRDYGEKREGRFHPTELGMVVINLLTGSFPDLLDPHYTARLEEHLDEVEHGSRTWKNLLREFYDGFESELKVAETDMPNLKRDGIKTDINCDDCGKPLVIKAGKYGQFLSCSDYPDCTGARKLKDVDPTTTEIRLLKAIIGKVQAPGEALDIKCPECAGDLIRKRGKYGDFIACSNYPDCKHIHKETIGVKCINEGCEGEVHVKKSKRGKIFYSCTEYPKCSYVSWEKPTGEPCPECKAPTLYEKAKKNQVLHHCAVKECGFSKELEPVSD